MDRFDKQILQILTRAADTSATEIGRLVGLSVPAVNKRIRRLKEITDWFDTYLKKENSI